MDPSHTNLRILIETFLTGNAAAKYSLTDLHQKVKGLLSYPILS